MDLLQTYKEDFFVLVEAGFIAVNQFDEDAAIKVFKAAELLDPSNSLPRVGLGYVHLCKLELKAATAIFDEVLHKDPSNEMAKTLMGLSQSLNPKELSKGENTLKEIASKATDSMVKSLAASALEFVEKFVKKNPSPAQAKPPKKTKK